MELSKTPEEIKKGLKCAVDKKCVGKECLYFNEEYACIRMAQIDALALIQQLEAQNSELLEKVKQLERERDAAIHDVAYAKRCRLCKHGQRGFIPRDCFSCAGKSNFEWRGPCKENGGMVDE